MNKLMLTAISLGAVSLLANYSSETSTDGPRKPKINFYGTLTDTLGQNYQFENLTISGMMSQIPMYQKPASPEVNPEINTTRVDLNEVASINVPNPNTLLKYKGREYIALEIISNNGPGTQQQYIIEASRKVYCDEVNSAGPVEKELSFQAIATIALKGNRPQPQHHRGIRVTTQEVEHAFTTTHRKLTELEREIGTVDDSKSAGWKEKVLDMITDVKQSLSDLFKRAH